ncbi:hypothetical protein DA2_2524 [Desulfovibrio sp. A2]|nr:hypothetical protein DA2_2524 [Desulfovibrio sp. A2]
MHNATGRGDTRALIADKPEFLQGRDPFATAAGESASRTDGVRNA